MREGGTQGVMDMALVEHLLDGVPSTRYPGEGRQKLWLWRLHRYSGGLAASTKESCVPPKQSLMH